MKVMFLDIDGVIAVDECFYTKPIQLKGKLCIPYSWHPPAIEALCEIIKQTDCKIVLSSDWRRHFNIDEMHQMFEYYGIPKCIIDTTDTLRKFSDSLESERTRQINTWITENLKTEDNWIVVDDLPLLFTNNFVQVLDLEEGIAAYKDQIIKILNNN